MGNFPNSSVLFNMLVEALGKPNAPGDPPPLDRAPEPEPPPFNSPFQPTPSQRRMLRG